MLNRVLVSPDQQAAVTVFDAVLCKFRADNFNARDPKGATACRRAFVKPIFDALRRNEPPPLALYWPESEQDRLGAMQMLRSHCRNCALCDEAKIAALMPPPSSAQESPKA